MRNLVSRGVHAVVVMVALCLLSAACAARPAVSRPKPVASLTTGVNTGPDSGMVAGSSTIPGLQVRQLMIDDPTFQVAVHWPVLPHADALNKSVEDWATNRERKFTTDNEPSTQAPQELNVSWQVMSAGDIDGVRLEAYEFSGADGVTTNQVFYGDTATNSVFPASELILPNKHEEIAALVYRDVVSQHLSHLDPTPPTGDDVEAVLTDLWFTKSGDLLVTINQGVLTPFSDGVLHVKLSAQQVQPLLSDIGKKLAQAVTVGNKPPSQTPVQPATASFPAVDCAHLKCIALTFDDGPGQGTETLFDRLDAAGVKATFFVIGRNAQPYHAVLARMAADGMAIGNHTWDHRDLTTLSLAAAQAEVAKTDQEVKAATGMTPTLLRPPYGAFNKTTRALGHSIILWNVDTEDWKNRNTAETTRRALAGARPGSIILMHDIHPTTVEAVPGIIATLKQRGYTFVTVPQLLGNPQPGVAYFSEHDSTKG